MLRPASQSSAEPDPPIDTRRRPGELIRRPWIHAIARGDAAGATESPAGSALDRAA